ncbi:hypothetical protein KKB99_04435 [bacterium]|nr:hypothetical protein [bacterium]MBU1025242.1 hypothetical protein [bacterium]
MKYLKIRILSLAGIAMLCLALFTGCLSAYGNAVVRDWGNTAVKQAIVSGVQNEIEGQRGTTVNVNNSYANSVIIEKPELKAWKYKDFNGNGRQDEAEFIELRYNEPVNIDNFDLVVAFYPVRNGSDITYSIFSPDGHKISGANLRYDKAVVIGKDKNQYFDYKVGKHIFTAEKDNQFLSREIMILKNN